MKGEMATLSISQNHLSVLQLIDWYDFPQVFVQAMDLLHLFSCQLEIVHLQVIQQLGFDNTLKINCYFSTARSNACRDS